MRGASTLTVLLLAVSLGGQGAIISQSSIKDCTWGDSSEPTSPGGSACNKKMLISMVLGSGQVFFSYNCFAHLASARHYYPVFVS